MVMEVVDQHLSDGEERTARLIIQNLFIRVRKFHKTVKSIKLIWGCTCK